jgi:hypothetical protein
MGQLRARVPVVRRRIGGHHFLEGGLARAQRAAYNCKGRHVSTKTSNLISPAPGATRPLASRADRETGEEAREWHCPGGGVPVAELFLHTLRERDVVPFGLDLGVADDAIEHTGGDGGGLEDFGQEVDLWRQKRRLAVGERRDWIGRLWGGRGRRQYLFPLHPWAFPRMLHVVSRSKYKREEGKKNNSSRAEDELNATRQIEQRAITRP